jgi:hypothetical protein
MIVEKIDGCRSKYTDKIAEYPLENGTQKRKKKTNTPRFDLTEKTLSDDFRIVTRWVRLMQTLAAANTCPLSTELVVSLFLSFSFSSPSRTYPSTMSLYRAVARVSSAARAPQHLTRSSTNRDISTRHLRRHNAALSFTSVRYLSSKNTNLDVDPAERTWQELENQPDDEYDPNWDLFQSPEWEGDGEGSCLFFLSYCTFYVLRHDTNLFRL